MRGGQSNSFAHLRPVISLTFSCLFVRSSLFPPCLFFFSISLFSFHFLSSRISVLKIASHFYFLTVFTLYSYFNPFFRNFMCALNFVATAVTDPCIFPSLPSIFLCFPSLSTRYRSGTDPLKCLPLHTARNACCSYRSTESEINSWQNCDP